MCIYQSLRTLQDRAGRNVGIKDTTNYYAIRGGISGGTMASVTTVADARELNTHEYSLLRGKSSSRWCKSARGGHCHLISATGALSFVTAYSFIPIPRPPQSAT